MRHEYKDSALVRADGPFMSNLVRAENALCPDGKRRNAFPTHDGIADTFFSVPAYVHARHEGKSVRVYGYVTTETQEGFTSASFADEVTVKFVPYVYRKHFAVICHPARIDDNTCLHCGRETQARKGNGTLGYRVHVLTGAFRCNDLTPEASTHTEVRDTQSYAVRTKAQGLPLVPASCRSCGTANVGLILCRNCGEDTRQTSYLTSARLTEAEDGTHNV